MTHWKSLQDREFMYAFDLVGKDVTLTIDRVVGGQLVGTGGKKSKKPLCHFKEGREPKPLALNATNCKTIAAMYGNEVENWAGKRITIYPTKTQMGGEEVDCIRVRPKKPATRSASPELPPPPPDDAPAGYSESNEPEPPPGVGVQ